MDTGLWGMTACIMIALVVTQCVAQQGFTNHGVAAPVSRSRGAAATVDADGHRIVVIWLADQKSCWSMLVVDAETGKSEQIPVDVRTEDSPFAVLLTADNKWYSQFGGRFYQFDPATRSFSFTGDTVDLVAMGMIESPTGVIWAGQYPAAHLVSFDPKTGELREHGAQNEENWPQYPSYMAAGTDGWVYVGIGNTRAQLVAYNPETGERRKLIPDDMRPAGACAYVFRATDGNVYATAPGWGYHKVSEGVATPCEEPKAPRVPAKQGSQESVFTDFPDGSLMVDLNVPERRLVIRDADGTERELNFEYKSEGSHVLSVHEGPDGAIYGSTGHPLRVYRYDPKTDELSDNGLLGENGHLNAMAVQRDKLYGAMYGGGVLYEYDVRQPWDATNKDNPNPRDLGRGDPDIGRPHALLAHPDGRRLIMGGTPGYGLTGGGLFIYDLEAGSGVVLSQDELIPEHSTNCLVALPDGKLVGGTTTMAGTGGEVLAEEAELYVFDLEARKVVWHKALLPGRSRIMDLLVAPDGLVYGLAVDSTLFVFDSEKRELIHEESLKVYGDVSGSQAPRIMALGPDGGIYALFNKAIVRIAPGTYEHQKLADIPVPAHAGIALLDGRLYFASGAELWSYDLAGAGPVN